MTTLKRSQNIPGKKTRYIEYLGTKSIKLLCIPVMFLLMTLLSMFTALACAVLWIKDNDTREAWALYEEYSKKFISLID